jgi:hypothetical protein
VSALRQDSEFVSDMFEKLKGQVERDCRFRIVISRLEIGGYVSRARDPDPRRPVDDEIRLLTADDHERILGVRLEAWELGPRSKQMEKSVLDFSVQDASAALPQNCQTT